MSQQNTNNRLVNALKCMPNDRPPVWFMRQAGRYMPAYQRVRKQAGSFMGLCKNPELACEVTLQPIDQFGLDAAIIFSDILTLADAMPVELKFHEGQGPIIHQPIRSMQDVSQRTSRCVNDRVSYVFDAIQLTQQSLAKRVPLIGFSGSPWTIGSYMVEGQLTKPLTHIKTMRFQEPNTLSALIDNLTSCISSYCIEQINHGIDALMLFDTWGGHLAYDDFLEFSLQPMQTIIKSVKAVHPNIPIIVFTKGASPWLDQIKTIGCQGIGLDYTVDLATAKAQLGPNIAIQGNLDPHALLGSADLMIAQANKCLDAMAKTPGYIFNLGHGILPSTQPDRVKQLVEHIKSYEASST